MTGVTSACFQSCSMSARVLRRPLSSLTLTSNCTPLALSRNFTMGTLTDLCVNLRNGLRLQTSLRLSISLATADKEARGVAPL